MLIRQANVEEEGPINLMPLIDMVFLLLIFFLIATTFAQEERDPTIELPGTAEAEPLSAPPRQIIINIKASGEMIVDTQSYRHEDALREMLAHVARTDPQREILIRCDERAFHMYFAGVARVCREAGINEVKIGYVIKPPRAVAVQ